MTSGQTARRREGKKMSKELMRALGTMNEQDVLENMIDQGEWSGADGDLFCFDNWNDYEAW